jgi:hypothetical protein
MMYWPGGAFVPLNEEHEYRREQDREPEGTKRDHG